MRENKHRKRMWCQLTDILMSMPGSSSSALEENGVDVFERTQGDSVFLRLSSDLMDKKKNVRGQKNSALPYSRT